MAVSVDWENTRVIFIPQADLTFIGGLEYELDVDAFHITLRDLEISEGGPWPTTHFHNTEVVIGGVPFARQVLISPVYTITFEDIGSSYAVTLVGANTDILDVTNLNRVSVRPTNSAGLVNLRLVEQLLRNRMETNPADGVMTLYDDAGAPLMTADISEDVAGSVPFAGGSILRKNRLE